MQNQANLIMFDIKNVMSLFDVHYILFNLKVSNLFLNSLSTFVLKKGQLIVLYTICCFTIILCNVFKTTFKHLKFDKW